MLAALPTSRAAAIAERLEGMLGTHVNPTDSFLGLTLGNPGQFIHPALMYGHFRSWRGEEYDEHAIPLLRTACRDMSKITKTIAYTQRWYAKGWGPPTSFTQASSASSSITVSATA